MRTDSWHHTDRVQSALGVRTRIVASASVFALVVSACAEGSPDPSDGVPEVRLIALPGIDGEVIPGQAGFGRIADLEISEDGSVFVLDRLNRRVQVFDDQGSYLRTFGQRGQGPGELERPVALAWGPGGDLWIVDPGNGRYTVFDAKGGLVATYGHSGGSVFNLWSVGFSEAGLFYFVTSGPDLMRQEFWLVESEVVNGQVREIRRIGLPFIEQPSGFEHRGDGTVMVLQIPFSSTPVLRIGRDGSLWYAATREPWVHRWSISGGLEQTFGREFAPPQVTPDEREEVLEREDIGRLRREAGPASVAEFASLIPDTKPHLQGFFLDDEENLWIVRNGQEASGDNTLSMDVYDPSGTLIAIGRAALEPEPRPRVRDRLMAGIIRDGLGVESIVLDRIER